MLEVSGTLVVRTEQGAGRIDADGRRIVLELDDSAALGAVPSKRALGALAGNLDRAGLVLEVRSSGRRLLQAGNGVRPGLVGRLLRLQHVRLSTRLVAGAALRRHTRK